MSKAQQPKYQPLSDVCNGGHLHSLMGWSTVDDPAYRKVATPDTILAAMGAQTKAIAVIQPNEQGKTLELFKTLEKEPHKVFNPYLGGPCKMEARRLGHWRAGISELWMVRIYPENQTWETAV